MASIVPCRETSASGFVSDRQMPDIAWEFCAKPDALMWRRACTYHAGQVRKFLVRLGITRSSLVADSDTRRKMGRWNTVARTQNVAERCKVTLALPSLTSAHCFLVRVDPWQSLEQDGRPRGAACACPRYAVPRCFIRLPGSHGPWFRVTDMYILAQRSEPFTPSEGSSIKTRFPRLEAVLCGLVQYRGRTICYTRLYEQDWLGHGKTSRDKPVSRPLSGPGTRDTRGARGVLHHQLSREVPWRISTFAVIQDIYWVE